MSIDPDSTGLGEHPDVEEISAFAEGVLPADRTDGVRSHLAGCDLCRDVRDSLDEIRDLLGRRPGPEQMPADVASRIEAALAAEALLSAAGPSSEDELTPEEEAAVRALLGGSDTWGVPSAEPDAERSDEALAGRAPGTQTPGTQTPDAWTPDARTPDALTRGTRPEHADADRHTAPPGRRDASTGPGRGGRVGPGRTARSRRRWPAVVLATACAAAVAGFGAFLINALGDARGGPGAKDGARESVTSAQPSPHVYTESGLDAQVRTLLSAAGDGSPKASEQEGSKRSPLVAPDGAKDTAPAAVPALQPCVLQATERASEIPLATDRGRYKGAPVGVVVLKDRSDARRVNVYLVDSSCETSSPGEPGTVLLQRTVPRS